MSTSTPLERLVRPPMDRAALAPLLRALGLDPILRPVPREAWPSFGVGGSMAAGIRALVVAGRAGSLDALLLEGGPDVAADRLGPVAAAVRARNPAKLHLFLFAEAGYRRLTLGVLGLDGDLRRLVLEPGDVRASDTAAFEDMVPRKGESGLALAMRYADALDRSRLTGRFFRDFRVRRDAVAGAWIGVPDDAVADRDRLALLFLSRLLFLYFLQRRGALAGDDRYLPQLFATWHRTAEEPHDGAGVGTFYGRRLVPLFFGALNRRPEDRAPEAFRLGPLPYLNGGLFERHPLERRHPDLDLPDDEVRACFDQLLERYRFTTRESSATPRDGIDPEMLGRVFEGLMAPGHRLHTGSFYTPGPIVHRVVGEALAAYVGSSCPGAAERMARVTDGDREALDPETRHRVRAALRRVRVLDPACGSGAFLLGALHRLVIALRGVSDDSPGELRRHVVAESLHGVDLLDDAALLCSLRLWLALGVDDGEVRPLPNLDRRIRQGDALVDPLDMDGMDLPIGGVAWQPGRDPGIRRAIRQLEPAARRYLQSEPDERAELRTRLDEIERELAGRWIRGAHTAGRERARRLRALAADRDLFGDRTESAHRAEAELGRIHDRTEELRQLERRLRETAALPFFSFGVHFADASSGFDVILSNPPWVRVHRWPTRLRRMATRFEVVRNAGWEHGARLAGATGAGSQVDLSLLFLERSLRLLAPGGVLGVVVPAKALRALYGGGTRRILLRELEIVLIEDYALDHRAIFHGADSFAAVLVARKRSAGTVGAPPPVRVRLVRRGVPPLEIRAAQSELSLVPGDAASPWLLAPDDARAAFRAMQAAGPPIGEHPGLRVRRGVMTGANDVLLFATLDPKLGGLGLVEAVGRDRSRRSGAGSAATDRYRALVELAGIRPVVRGADIDAFTYRTDSYMAWCHAGDGAPRPALPRLAAYLERHADRLRERSGWRPGLPLGCVFRLGPDTLAPKVAWHDLSDTLRAVALPRAIRVQGRDRELVPVNTVYFIALHDPADAALLAGYLNSLPVRTMARSYAERAKDARFRFFAWTVASLPLPSGWRAGTGAARIRAISAAAHENGGIRPTDAEELDLAVGAMYGLTGTRLEALRVFDRWLRGKP